MNLHSQSKSLIILILLATLQQGCKNETSSNADGSAITSIFTPNKFDIDVLQTSLKAKLDSNVALSALSFFGKTDSVVKIYQQFYASNNYNAVWVHEDGLSSISQQFLQVLDSLQYDALSPEKYYYTNLKERTKTIENEKNIDSIIQFELDMTNSFFTASKDLALGSKRLMNLNKEWKNTNDTLFSESVLLKKCVDGMSVTEAFESNRPNHPWYKKFKEEYCKLLNISSSVSVSEITDLQDSIAIGFNSPSVAILRKKMHHEVGVPLDTISTIWTEDILDAVKRFQFKNQIKQTGKIDTNTLTALKTEKEDKIKKIALNMERLRWMRHEFKQPFIWVNVPKMELDYYDKDLVEFNMRVVVGKTSRKTPTLDAKIENIVFSPPWNVPETIMKQEIIPGISRRGGSYLSRRGLKATDSRGRPVNPSVINSSNFRRFNISQAPGYRSSLGEVKFNMPNPWAIYLHDTPHREDFVKSYRAYSSGCIRVHKPKEFAEFLIQDTSLYSYNKIDSICKMRRTISLPMKREINVHIVYLTNAIDSNGNIMYLKDVYGWDKNMN
jgi:murein L,D-transpeptidase YcbB/YkuD